MRIIMLNSNVEIINKVLSKDELFDLYKKRGNLVGFEYVINLFEYFFNLDVNDYTIRDLIVNDDNIILKIKPEDLSKIREIKLNKIL
jgi:cytidylate kinase